MRQRAALGCSRARSVEAVKGSPRARASVAPEKETAGGRCRKNLRIKMSNSYLSVVSGIFCSNDRLPQFSLKSLLHRDLVGGGLWSEGTGRAHHGADEGQKPRQTQETRMWKQRPLEAAQVPKNPLLQQLFRRLKYTLLI